MSSGSPPDQAARVRIVADLKTSFLVEAGAGAGKTTLLVARMVALVASGLATVDQIAAVTFTRKAAAELRERFQAELEQRLRDSEAGSEEQARMATAVERIETAFLGTIHAFAARLLRERPIEAGLDPGFQEVLEIEAREDARRFWSGHLERLATDGSPLLEDLVEVGLRPNELERSFYDVAENLDVTFPAPETSMPAPEEIAPVRRRLETLIDDAMRLLPDEEPAMGWDGTQSKVRSALYFRRRFGWDDPEVFFDSLYAFGMANFNLVQKRWVGGQSAGVRQLRDRFEEFREDPATVALLEHWLDYRYAPAIRFLVDAAQRFRERRRREGRLTFQDLLTFSLDLLRTEPVARRDLGLRYRWLLVDEFQDTDPLQAELVFLLASDPGSEELEGAVPDWRTAQPRSGALFMVGDPKQSIYRFRRADIAVYNFVRDRMSRAGQLLRLTANFRSLLPIAGIVNDVFTDIFPDAGNPYQAPYAPLRPQRGSDTEPPPVHTYRAEYRYRWGGADAQSDAQRIASWIHQRVEAGQREPGDFLVLLKRKKHLATYARALEARRLPVDVAGAGVGFRRDLDELVILLEALADPDDPTRVVAALGGLFMGVDPLSLARHKLAGGRFGLVAEAESRGDPGVRDILRRLTGWWERSRVQPADIFIAELVDELGLVPHAVAAELGALRAGALAYVMDVVRARAAAGDTSLVGVTDAIRAALDWEDAEAPLEPGGRGAVRLMNVHKCKGLQAPVVILAEPGGHDYRGRELHVTRTPGGEARGFLQLQRADGRKKVPIARPRNWRDLEEEEERYGRAEDARLLYVALTRARDELLVGRAPGKSDKSLWGPADSWLAQYAREEELVVRAAPDVAAIDAQVADVRERISSVRRTREAGATPTYRFDSVSALARRTPGDAPEMLMEGPAPMPSDHPGEFDPRAEPSLPRVSNHPTVPDRPVVPTARGYEWGSIVHAALAAAATNPDMEILERTLTALLREGARPLRPDGVPRELEELWRLVDSVIRSDLWKRARSATRRFSEMPFAVRLGADQGPAQYVEGVIDLVFEEDGRWVVADYKTDIGDDPDFPARRESYRAQVDLYARCWSELIGEEVAERMLVFTSLDQVERW